MSLNKAYPLYLLNIFFSMYFFFDVSIRTVESMLSKMNASRILEFRCNFTQVFRESACMYVYKENQFSHKISTTNTKNWKEKYMQTIASVNQCRSSKQSSKQRKSKFNLNLICKLRMRELLKDSTVFVPG